MRKMFFGKVSYTKKKYVDETAKLIDQEIRGFIDEAEGHARKILKKYIKHLHSLAKALLEFETLSGDEVNELIKKGKIKSNKHDDIDSNNKKTSIPLGKTDVKRKKILA